MWGSGQHPSAGWQMPWLPMAFGEVRSDPTFLCAACDRCPCWVPLGISKHRIVVWQACRPFVTIPALSS